MTPQAVFGREKWADPLVFRGVVELARECRHRPEAT